ncbi:MAG: thioredoxin family protein [Saprospiraceae bacterium]|nr:thioredoxin family protein [Saprospiraceae bacterium]
MKYLSIVTVVFFLFSCSSTGSKSHPGWGTNLEDGIQKAASDNKYVFALFTGSDWCPPCKKLEADVLENEQFKKLAGEKFVEVVFDFPRKPENQLSAEQATYNNNTAQKYFIEGFPTVIIFDKNGNELKRWVGYMPTALETTLGEYQSVLR